MHDDLEPDFDAVEGLDGVTPRLFGRVFVSGEDEEGRRDALALAAALAEAGETVTVAGHADLIVAGSARDGAPGRVALDPADRTLLEGAGCPIAVAPRGLAGLDGYGLRRIDVGIDGGRGAAAALDLAVRLTLRHDALLRPIAVAEPGATGRQSDPGELERLSRRLGQATEALVGIRVETELREGPAARILLDLAREADLLMLGSRAGYGNTGRVVIGDVAGRVLGAAPCPTLVVPAA